MVRTRQTRPRAAAAALRFATAGLLAGLLALAAPVAAVAATLEARVDRDVVDADDTVRLTLQLDDPSGAGLPDLSPLATDFDVLGTQQSQSLTVVNGRPESSRSLQIVLRPRRSGELTIPPLRAGDAVSDPIRVSVLDGTAPAPGASGAAAGPPAASARGASDVAAAPDIFIEATTDEANPFVQGEVRYTVRVYDAIGMREGALTEPAADGVRFEPLGDTRTYERELNGRRYRVHERQYALFPQTSGPVTIPPLVLQARVPDPDRAARRAAASPFGDARARDFFADDFFRDDVMAEMLAQMRAAGMRMPFGGSIFDRLMPAGREVRVRSNAVTLDVAAKPADAPEGWFLPARAVELSQSFNPAGARFRVGETVERRVVLRAAGASAGQLPPLNVSPADGIRQYARNPEQRTLPTSDGVVSEVVRTFELVPTEPGTFTLPAVEVPWWDVEAGVARTAKLAAQTIEVLPAPGTASGGPAPAAQVAATSPAKVPLADETAGGAAAAAPSRDAAGTLFPSALTVGGAVAALLLVVAATWWLARRTRRPDHRGPDARDGSRAAPASSARTLVDALRQACAARNARAVRDALLAWGRATWPDSPPASTSAVARRLGHPGFTAAVKMLDDSLYAPRSFALDGERLWREFRSAQKQTRASAGDVPDPLPALYPSSRVA